MKSKSDLNRLLNISDDEIDENIQSDPDTFSVTDEQLNQFKKVNPSKTSNVKAIRLKMKLSQAQFALFFGVSKRTIQQWEQGRSTPNQLAKNFLKVIAYNPIVVQDALQKEDFD